MPKQVIEGLNSAKGTQGFSPLIAGDYLVEVNDVRIDEEPNGKDHDMWNFKCSVIEGPMQPGPDGTEVDPNGRMVFHGICILKPAHGSFEQWGHLGVNQLKAMANACKVKVSKDDGLNTDSFIGQQLVMKVRVREYEGEDRNEVVKVSVYEEE